MAKKNQPNSKPLKAKASWPPKPNPALKRLDKLVGRWRLTGRTFDSKVDNITGKVAIEWLPGGFFLQMRGVIRMQGLEVQSLEIVGYDAATKAFSASVYSNLDEVPGPYYWNVKGNRVTHWTKGSKYTGTFSENGQTLSGGWRPEKGQENTGETTYDAIMTRVNGK
jgi:hypothetical protein